MKKRYLLLLVIPLALLAACQAPEWGNSVPTVPATAIGTAAPAVEAATASPTTAAAFSPTEAITDAEASSPSPTLASDAWKSMPIVPQVSERMVEVYRAGLAAGRDPTHFSKIGDCQNITTYFLAEFDDPTRYSLGSEYAYLQSTIDYFSGSWSRESLAVKGGMNVAAVQNPFWTLTPRPAVCKTSESPLACELRVYNPSIAIISMEESWSGDIGKYDGYLRKIVEYVLSQNVVPILVTRAETTNPPVSINATVARIAYDYQVPLWNFWAAAYPLPAHGLTSDEFHLTWAGSFFDDPQRMQMGWPWRNLTALQAIDAVWHDVNSAMTATATPTTAPTPTPAPVPDPADWQSWPVIPSVSDEMTAVYQKGLELGNNPKAFSKIGDDEISSTWFLTDFDLGAYKLGSYTDLRPVIGRFFGSYGRVSQAAENGFTTSLILDPSAANQQVCNDGETPLDCELRLHRPSFAFVSLGANQTGEPGAFETGLRQIIERLLEKGVVPILSTKADNLEGDYRINQIITRVAAEYHVPLWNFWLAVQPLPGNGLQEDVKSLTYAELDFSDVTDMQAAWPWRNLTALQALDTVWRSVTTTPAATATHTATSPPAAATSSLDPADWQNWPVIPSVPAEMAAVYQKGLGLGNNPNAFSKIGDGEISAEWFLTGFDLGNYNLGTYTELQPVISEFSGSYERVGQAARRGFNTTLILDPKASDKQACDDDESPLDCELRLNKPSFAFVSLGTNQVWQPEIFEPELRQIVEHLLDKGVVPILSTKADNLEGDYRIDQIIARLAAEYHVPLWNFWLAVQPLPGNGLQEDMEHLTYADSDFSNATDMLSAWPWRNLTALQALDAVWRGVMG